MSKFTPFSLFIRQALLYPLISPFLPAEADVKKGVSYANSQKTGTLANVNYPADQQFVDNGDGTISDLATGLMWVQNAADAGGNYGTGKQWAAAVTFCDNLIFAGHNDWRLPTRKELDTIVDTSRANPAINTDYFFNILSLQYWTITPYISLANYIWYVMFSTGTSGPVVKTATYRILPVRTIT